MNKARKSRKIKTLNRLQQKLDDLGHLERYRAMLNGYVTNYNKDDVYRVNVYFMEDKLQQFIDFLNKDKKRFLDLEKAKYDFIEYLINKNRKNILKG